MKRSIQFIFVLSVFTVCLNSSAVSPEIVRTNVFRRYDTSYPVAFSPDATLIGVGANTGFGPYFGTFRTSDLTLLVSYGLAGDEVPASVAISDDNGMMAFVSYDYSPGRGALEGIPPTYVDEDIGQGTAVAFTPSIDCVRWLVVAGPQQIHKHFMGCWSENNWFVGGGHVFPNSSQDGWVSSLVIHPNGATFLIGTSAGTIQRWQIEPPQLLWRTNFTNNSVLGINILPDGREVITIASNTGTFNVECCLSDVRLWEIGATNFRPQIRPELPLYSTTLTPDGKYLFTVIETARDIGCDCNPDYHTNHVVLWRVSDGREIIRYTEDLPDVFQVAVAPDGKTFAYGRGDGIVAIARMPLLLDEIARSGNQTILKWQGGSGLFQLQSRTNFTSGSWENLGSPTTNTMATNASSTTLFFRVQSLPVP